MIVLPLLAAVTALVTLGAVGIPVVVALGTRGVGIAVALCVAGAASTSATLLFNVALVFAATDRIEGRTPTVRGTLARAWGRRAPRSSSGRCSRSVAGTLFRALEQRLGGLGHLVGFAGALAWSVATFMVLPVLAFEDLGPLQVLRRSSSLLTERFGTVTRAARCDSGCCSPVARRGVRGDRDRRAPRARVDGHGRRARRDRRVRRPRRVHVRLRCGRLHAHHPLPLLDGPGRTRTSGSTSPPRSGRRGCASGLRGSGAPRSPPVGWLRWSSPPVGSAGCAAPPCAEHRRRDPIVGRRPHRPAVRREGIDAPRPLPRCPACPAHAGVAAREVRELRDLGVSAVLLFGVPERKDPVGSAASDPDGIVQVALRDLRDEFGDDVVLIADLCLDEYTDHGHCGIARPPTARSTTTPPSSATPRIAVVAGRRRRRRRRAQRDDGRPGRRHPRGARRARAHATPGSWRLRSQVRLGALRPVPRRGRRRDRRGGDRRGYQQDPANAREALEEIRADIDEGADIVMVKPALTYLDIVSRARAEVDIPLAAYHVSGEYAMVHAAAANGWIDGDAVALEQISAIKRAGADLVLTYFARSLAEELSEADRVTNDDLFERASASSPVGSTRRCAPFTLLAARHTLSPEARARMCTTPTATGWSISCRATARHRRPRPPGGGRGGRQGRGRRHVLRRADASARSCSPRPSRAHAAREGATGVAARKRP